MLICVLCFVQLGSFVDVKTFQFLTHSLTNGSYFQFQFQGCLFSLKIEATILNPGLTHLKSSSIIVSTIPEQRTT